jgi:hypothetical protein
MPRVSEIFASGFLKAEHLNGQPLTVTIDGWAIEKGFGGAEVYVVHLVEDPRKLRLSHTCAYDIARTLGIDEMANWVGGKIALYPSEMTLTDQETNLKKTVLMIRARAPAGVSPTSRLVPGPTPPRKTTDLDDEIPF